MTGYVLISLLVALAVIGVFWGADTRDGRDWQPRHDDS
jgi:hypothetical protein